VRLKPAAWSKDPAAGFGYISDLRLSEKSIKEVMPNMA